MDKKTSNGVDWETWQTSFINETFANLRRLTARQPLLNLWTDARYFDVDKFVDTVGNVPPEFLQLAFLMLKPVSNLVEKYISLAENVHRDEFVDDYLHMETWLNDNVPVPGEVYREWAKYLFQQNLLMKNRMPLGRHILICVR
jgi:polyhydroxyalkanoate synthase